MGEDGALADRIISYDAAIRIKLETVGPVFFIAHKVQQSQKVEDGG